MLALVALVLTLDPGARPVVSNQGQGLTDGGSWVVHCDNCSSGGGGASLVWVDGGFLHVVVDSSSTISTTVNNFPATQAVSLASVPTHAVTLASTTLTGTSAVSLASLPALAAGSAVIGHVVVDTAPTTAVTLATAPTTPVTGTFWQSTQPVSVASLPVAGVYAQGPDGGTTLDVSGSIVSLAAAPQSPNRFPLNPFLPRCNALRRTGCQP